MNDTTQPKPFPMSPEPLPLPAMDHDTLTGRIAELLGGTYHCGRAWSAWGVNTMTEDDFTELSETEIPADIATMILELIQPLAQEAANWRHVRNLPSNVIGQPGQLCLAMRMKNNSGMYLRGTSADEAVAQSIEAERMRTTAILDPSL